MTIQLTVHEDAGPCSKRLSAACVSFSALLAEGCEKVILFPIATAIVNKDTDDDLIWSLILQDLADLTVGPDDDCWDIALFFAKADEEQRSGKWG